MEKDSAKLLKFSEEILYTPKAMANGTPQLPARFPCWCRATYSWGGESKRDLGFIEGDLIECLNAGDGSWWMGRLRRNKTTGLFPSNFVKVLDASFQPVNRGTSPFASPNGSLSAPKATPQKTKTYRKPFQSYARASTPNMAASQPLSSHDSVTNSSSPSRQSIVQHDSNLPSKQPSYLQVSQSPNQQSSHVQHTANPTRQLSYASPTRHGTHLSRPSQAPKPSRQPSYASRTPSPAPFSEYEDNKPSNDIESSPPPPPPPPHRIAYNVPPTQDAPSPNPSMNDRYTVVSRGHSPAPHSPRTTGQTPSPLRDAMDDVMSSLNDMQMRRGEDFPPLEPEDTHTNPWSPEAFEELRANHSPQSKQRPRSSMGIASSQIGCGEYKEEEPGSFLNEDDSPSGVDDYVERMETRFCSMRPTSPRPPDELFLPNEDVQRSPAVPPKNSLFQARPQSSLGRIGSVTTSTSGSRRLRARKSAYELGRNMLDRTFTVKSNTTNSSSGVQSVSTNGTVSTQRIAQSVMSGHSAGGFSATSAGSYARRKWGSISRSRPQSVVDIRQDAMLGTSHYGSLTRPQTPGQMANNQSRPASRTAQDHQESMIDSGGLLGGLTTPKNRKSGFFRKLVDSARAGAASTRSHIADGRIESQRSPIKGLLPNGVTAIAGGTAARDMGLAAPKNEMDWVQIRRDVNRSNSLSRNERAERIERCEMMNCPVIASVDELNETAEGDEGADGMPVHTPIDYQSINLQLVDKSARFVNSLPHMTNATNLAQGYLCRPYRSDVQRLRSIFTWVSEKVAWEEDFEGDVDTRRVIQLRRGCSEEIAVLVYEMCTAVDMHAEVVRGFLKTPGEIANTKSNHWWNAVIVDGHWRIMDCSLAGPTNPKRSSYSSAGPQVAENGYFLARPTEICYTHVPEVFEQQHIYPLISLEVLLALPCTCPPYFKNGLQIVNYDTSAYRIENLELIHVQFNVPSDVECVAEVEAHSYAYDADGDMFESGDTTTTRALAQAEWVGGQKRYTVKAHLPVDAGNGSLKVYAGKRGLMHSVKDNPHPLAFALPIIHTGDNPPYEFFLRHPTPHAQRHDLYVAQPQCRRLALNNTFVFAVRQHPSSLSCISPSEQRPASPLPFARPTSAMSMVSAAPSDYFSQTSSNSSSSSGNAAKQDKPAKLAIQAPSGKIIRLMRKSDNAVSMAEAADGGIWETIIKVGERGVWRGLVLADRSARWCVFGEWNCV